MTLASQLLAWYNHNARKLPWRNDKDAYKIWVSEIMLQQTRVEAVKDYYARWMERFPTMAVLAKASEQEVLSYWQGLGYYSRARNLLSGVREVCAAYGGEVPAEQTAIQNLPGVGEYTAGAIASIAYNRPVPAIDGNVLRIFSRLFCLEEDIARPATKREVRRLVCQHMSVEYPGDFNQALMDLGAMVCIPRHPRCENCPLTNLCEAYEREVQDTLPVRSPKKAPLLVKMAAGLVFKEESFLVRQRPAAGLLAKMWEFPAIELTGEEDAAEQLQAGFEQELCQNVQVEKKIFHYIHTFSHRQWDISFYQCEWLGGGELPSAARWLSPADFMSIPWAGPHRKVALACKKTPSL
ncbi:A/G-specific adenine glycosylase [Sporomusa acidovorans]|uniref:Adenine DNA glycosylase n=1 Tax=Sporomusa acidovorans (strain ATCC 49682 / DSM 3132 / Mol) TaxID=1123286 RepID=A0ABZ3J0Q6_SPOA4|nr:A/G-specific adenine glycosylase [Sporomusa acidovorans]OZC22821.1 putative A/G-specific adenine glycosylase YfhQ [Sporomusa acidovorans DSM 3132]SDE52052.1 A/G-specific DNA-adenine glycosylase [Sporomusa acidovorans]